VDGAEGGVRVGRGGARDGPGGREASGAADEGCGESPPGDAWDPGDLRVALVHEWLTTWGGSELVLRELAALFPNAPLYAAVWAPEAPVREAFAGREVRTTFLDRLPGVRRYYRWTLPLMPGAYRALDLSGYEVVISSSTAFAKAVGTGPEALHLCYCHTPPRYLWGRSWGRGEGGGRPVADAYARGLSGTALRLLGPSLRRADLRAARGVDRFMANSEEVRGRIRRVYGRNAGVVHPPVAAERFRVGGGEGGYYLAGGRMVAYKALDVAVEAANRARFPLRVFGDGPERRRLEARAGPTVELVGRVSDRELAELLAGCRAFLFPGVEDFGILPVEAQAAGRPVVARDAGGARETVLDGMTGVLYPVPAAPGERDEADALLAGIERLEALAIEPGACRRHAEAFGPQAFREGLLEIVREELRRGRG